MRTREILVWIGIALLVMTLSGALIYSCNKPRDIFAEATDHLNTADDLIKEGEDSRKENQKMVRRFIRGNGGNCSEDQSAQQATPGNSNQQNQNAPIPISEDSILFKAKEIAEKRKSSRELEDRLTGTPQPAPTPTPTSAPSSTSNSKKYKSGGSSQTKTTIINNNYYNNSSRDSRDERVSVSRKSPEATMSNSNSSGIDNSSYQKEEKTTTTRNRSSVRIDDQDCKPVLKPELVKKYGLTTKMVGRQEMVVYPDGTPYRGEYGHPFVDGTKKENGTVVEKNF